MNKMCCIHTMEYYSALKNNEIIIHATTWVNIGDIIQSVIKQTQNYKYHMIPLI